MMSSLNISKQHADDMFYKNNPFKPKSNFISKPINPTDKLNFEDEVQLYLEKIQTLNMLILFYMI